MKQLDSVLKVVGIRTQQVPTPLSPATSLAALCSLREKGSNTNEDEAEPVDSENPSVSSSLHLDSQNPNNTTFNLDLDPDLEEYDSFNLHTCSDLDLNSEYSLTYDSVAVETAALDSLKLTSPTDELKEVSKDLNSVVTKSENGPISPVSNYALNDEDTDGNDDSNSRPSDTLAMDPTTESFDGDSASDSGNWDNSE